MAAEQDDPHRRAAVGVGGGEGHGVGVVGLARPGLGRARHRTA